MIIAAIIVCFLLSWLGLGYLAFIIWAAVNKLNGTRTDELTLGFSIGLGPLAFIGMIFVLIVAGALFLMRPVTRRIMDWAQP